MDDETTHTYLNYGMLRDTFGTSSMIINERTPQRG